MAVDGVGGPDRAMPLAFVADLDVPVLDDAARHHLDRVRRLRPGDPLTVGDGAGRWRPVRFGPELEPDGPVLSTSAPFPTIGVGLALVKGERPELAVQKLTEVGVDRIVVFRAERSVVRWDEAKATRNVERLRTVAREAAAQSHRAHLPVVEDVVDFAALAPRPGVALAHPDGGPPTLATPLLLVGPEGGWSPTEEAAVPTQAAIGAHVLRAETAAIVAGALLVSLREGLVGTL